MICYKVGDYSYKLLAEGERQYDTVLLNTCTPVCAEYVKALSPCDEGNPFIEALPYPLMDAKQTIDTYSRPLLAYDGEEERNLPAGQRILRLTQLRQLRFPLPFHQELELHFYNALCTSYRVRTHYHDENEQYCCTVNNDKLSLANRLTGNLADAANAGIAVLGYSGCGKSSAMKILLSRYPQVIFHTFDGNRMPQIVYLMVSCMPNSNFAALYAGIGRAIDTALGLTHVFEEEVRKKRTLGEKLGKIIELVERFAIGMIIFDEIQLIDFSSTKENSFESLLVLTNETKVAVTVIGTEDAYSKMFTSLRTARRIGVTISGSMYCHNKEYCRYLVGQLFRYQWFDKRIELTDELFNAMYDNTRGIVDQLVGLYMHMQLAYLSTRNRPTIDRKYVESICNKYYPGVRDLLSDIANPQTQKALQKIMENARSQYDLKLAEARQLVQAQEILDSASKIEKRILKKNVIQNIRKVESQFSVDTVAAAFEKVAGRETNGEMDETKMTQAVFKELRDNCTLKRKPEEKVKRTATISHNLMREKLLE